MAESDAFDEVRKIESETPDVMRQMVQKWKSEHREKQADLDLEMFMKIIKVANGSSAIKVACNPLDEDHDWIPDTPCYNIGNVYVDEQQRLVLCMRRDKTEYSVEKMLDTLKALKKQGPSRFSKIMLQITDDKIVELTDIYSHALVRDNWAGLPFDIVLAYYDEDAKKEKKGE